VNGDGGVKSIIQVTASGSADGNPKRGKISKQLAPMDVYIRRARESGSFGFWDGI
jgi:hypothetical protein